MRWIFCLNILDFRTNPCFSTIYLMKSSAKIKKSTPNEVDFLFKYIGFSYKSLLFYYLSNGMSTKVKFLSP